MKEFSKITDAQMKARGVQALADRPNQTGQFGVSGLTAAQVKQHFDMLATYLAGKLNEVFKVLASDVAAHYIKLAIYKNETEKYEEQYEDLGYLVNGIATGDLAKRVLRLYPSASAEELKTLQAIVNDFAEAISKRVVQITEPAAHQRVYAIGKDGEQKSIEVANESEVHPRAIPVYDAEGNLVATNLITSLKIELDREECAFRLSLMAGDAELCVGVLTRDDILYLFKTVYDKDGDGVVDDSKALDGHEAKYFAVKELTENGLKRATISSVVLTADNRLRFKMVDGSIVDTKESIFGYGGGASGSATTQTSLSVLEWDASSVSKNTYTVKAFKFDSKDKQTNVDFEVRVGTKDGVFFRYPCNLQRPFGGASRIIFRTPRIIFEDESKKNVVTYLRAYEKGFDPIYEEISEMEEGRTYYIGHSKAQFVAQYYESIGCIAPPSGLIYYDDADVLHTVTYNEHDKLWSAYAEDEGAPDVSVYTLVDEGNPDEREIWFEIKTASSASMPVEYHFNLQAKSGTVTDVELVQKTYEPYVAKSGYDSLTISSADWANKTSNLNISSRAAAPYASASGNDSRAEGEAGDVGGIGNTCSGKADFVRGNGNVNTGDNVIQSGKGNTNRAKNVIQGGESNVNDTGASNSVQGGSGNYNSGPHTTQIAIKSRNDGGSDVVQFGHTMINRGDHVFQHGWECYNEFTKPDGETKDGYNYVDMLGSHLIAARVHQMLRGIYNLEDARALFVFGNGTSESNRKNAYTLAASGTPEITTDLVNLGFFDTEAFKEKIIAAFPSAEGSEF